MPKVQLTPNFIRNISPLPGKARTEWIDQSLANFYAEARATSPGKGTYYLRYKDASGTTRHMRLGTTESMSLAEARAEAKKQKAEIQLGSDPYGKLCDQKSTPTFRDFSVDYLEYVRPRKKSYRDDEIRIAKMLPVLGDYPLNKISKKQLVDYQLRLAQSGKSPATTNHYLKLIRYMLNLAVDWGILDTSPATRIKMLPVNNQKNPSLTPEQLNKFLSVLRNDDHPVSHLAQLLLFTGARKGEALNSVGEDFDIPNNIWHINSSYSKSGKSRPIPLNLSAQEVLRLIKPNGMTGALFTIKTVDKKWKKLKEEAGVDFLTLHSLRHLFASYLVNQGASLYIVQRILGHSSSIITERYSHLKNSSLVDAAFGVDEILSGSPKPPTPPLKLVRRGS